MKIIKVNASAIKAYESRNQFILLSTTTDCNYYLINDEGIGYEQVQTIPNLNNIVQGTLEGVIQYASYLSNLKIQQDVAKLQEELKASDYMVLKMYEYSLVGKLQPYNISVVHNERQTIRDKINVLQSQVKDNKTWEELSNVIVDNRKNIII